MKTSVSGLVVGFVLLAGVSTALADLNRFAGRWQNVDPNTRGVTTLDIRVAGVNVTLQAWGKCHPRDCDWGRFRAFAYGQDVSSNLTQTAQAISAAFQTGFSETLVIVHPAEGDRLTAEVLTRFTDSSRRTNYRNVYTFSRAAAPPRRAQKLPAPRQISPTHGTVFNHYPRKTTLKWGAVSGADKYTVEIDCYQCCGAGKWCTDVGRVFELVPDQRGTAYTFSFVGAQPGRWRVWAVDSAGQEGHKSRWWEFRYTR